MANETGNEIKLVVIDDIRSVVEMVSRKPPWQEHGIGVAGTALDGEEGIRLIEETKPDIVLTDIRMPKMDGLAMTKAILSVAPATKVVILSAYTDFAYAQQAIRLGAFDFLKKPFSIDEIVKTVLNAKKALLDEREENERRREMERERRLGLPMLQQEHLSLLIHHPFGAEKAAQQWKQLGIGLETAHFNVFVVEFDHFMEKYKARPAREIELMRFSLKNVLEETVSQRTKGVVFREASNRFVCIMNCSDIKEAESISEACRRNTQQYTHSTVSIGVGLCVGSIQELPDAYQQAVSALSYHFYTDGNGVTSYTVVKGEGEALSLLPNYSLAAEQEFLFALKSGNSGKCRLLLERIFNDMLQSEPLPAPQHVESLCFELSAKICRTMQELFPQARVHELEKRWLAGTAGTSSTFMEMREMVQGLCEEACGWTRQERLDESSKLIYEAKDYICDNLHVDLSLEHCAKRFNISQGYFSNLFKKVLGISYQQFVIHQRMERAKDLLIGGYQVQEIALLIGYEHRRYFSDAFKKHTNMTPSEFKIYSTGIADAPLELEQGKG
ncbi:response regulator [Paenibacillus harenae]|uniref:response regulator n=1 Tax=Paenibacillus harenae TaxID=306543 RepID=UPI00278D7198|nr:response regulator [Paenibacillus harenae]MDQ0061427.1 two-component system response regulator YesN [Paenibacillus harenae]